MQATWRRGWIIGVAVLVVSVGAPAQERTSHNCTYQGYLKDAQSVANGDYDFKFTIYDAAEAGIVIAGPLYQDDESVQDGLFTIKMNIGDDTISGDDRWLQVSVRPGDSTGSYTDLSPRQELTAAPHALMAFQLKLPYAGSTASNSVAAFKITQSGARKAGLFVINNAANNDAALLGSTTGSGLAMQASNSGTGGAGFFDISNPGNLSDVVQATQSGLGRAGFFEIAHPTSDSATIESRTDGFGPAGYFWITNPTNVDNAIHTRTDGSGYALWAENLGAGNAAIFANAQNGPGAEIVTQTGAAPAVQAINMGGGVAVHGDGRIETNDQFVSTLATGTSPLDVASTTLNSNLNADMVDGQHLTGIDGRYVNEGQANSINNPMLLAGAVSSSKLADDAVTTTKLNNSAVTGGKLASSAVTTAKLADDAVSGTKLAHNINASGIGFDAAKVNGATISMGTWSTSSTATFLSLHGGDVHVKGTGSHNEKLRFTNNLGGEVRVSIISPTDALSSQTTVWGGTTVDITYWHYTPFMAIVSEASGASEWTTVLWICENDGVGSYLAINHNS
jgi:hypothetical protein